MASVSGSNVVQGTELKQLIANYLLERSKELCSNQRNENDRAIEHLLSFLPISDLKRCRLVNRSWNLASVKVISQTPLGPSIKFPMNPNPKYPRRSRCTTHDIPDLLPLIKSSSGFPWTKFKMDARLVTTRVQRKVFGRFFQVVAPFATSLWIHDILDRPFDDQNTELYPALSFLKLDYGSSVLLKNTEFALRLMAKTPNLNMIELTGDGGMMSHFVDILATPNGQKIKRVYLESLIEDQDLVLLSKIGLQCKFLSLHFHGNNRNAIGAQAFCLFLQSLSGHLEELELTQSNVFVTVKFPRMEKLKKITLNDSHNFKFAPVDNDTFLFPALKQLLIKYFLDKLQTSWNDLKPMFNAMKNQLKCLTELHLAHTMNDPRTILEVGKKLPNLRKLELLGSAELLDCVQLEIPDLEELHLHFLRENVDVVLTGFNENAIKNITESPLARQVTLAKKWKPRGVLKNLRKLVINMAIGIQFPITDFGCLFALLKMRHLKMLEFAGDVSRLQISDAMMKVLRAKFTVCVEQDEEWYY